MYINFIYIVQIIKYVKYVYIFRSKMHYSAPPLPYFGLCLSI